MKTKWAIILSVFVFSLYNLGAQEYNWAKQNTGDYGLSLSGIYLSLTSDENSGSIFVAGATFGDDIMFDGISAGDSKQSLYIAKYELDGDVKWVKYSTNNGYHSMKAVSLDADNGLLSTGTVDGKFVFDGQNIEFSGAFIMKHDTSGNFQWVKKGEDMYGKSVACDESNNVYALAGYSLQNIAGVSWEGSSKTLYAKNDELSQREITIVKYNSSGDYQWSTSIIGTEDDYGNNIVVNENRIFVSGSTSSDTITFKSAGSGSDIDYTAGGEFIARYDANNGDVSWVKPTIGGERLAVDHTGLYVTGGFKDTATIGGDSVISNGSVDLALLKHKISDGTLEWVKSAGGSSFKESGADIILDDNGYLYVTSNTGTGTCIFHDGSTLEGTGPFVAKYDINGNYIWSVRSGESTDCKNYALAKGKNTNIYGVGSVKNTGYYGTYELDGGTNANMALYSINDTTDSPPLTEKMIINQVNPGTEIYPNPVNNRLNIHSSDIIQQVRIFTLQGKLIKHYQLAGEKEQLVISDLNKGIYLLEITLINGEKEMKKFIKQ
jgi:hypothetical protein